jgi:glycosyltransferase involved in cell wall biosynthesis
MSRAALLPSPIDPFVLLHCLHYFDIWSEEIDKLYICLNSNIEESIVKELFGLIKHPKIVFFYHQQTLGHGKAINFMLENCKESEIVLIEDDSIIFKKGILNKYFNFIESGDYDLIGSPRMSCSKETADSLAKEFNLNYEGFGDKGPNFWPCFLFTKKHFLLKTDQNFGNTKWGDTFVWASIQLRRMGLKILEIPQYHLNPDDEKYKSQNLSIFDEKCGYFHIGSLSSGIENTLLDNNGYPLKDRKLPQVKPVKIRQPQTDQEKLELERRVMWWSEAYNMNIDKFGNFGEQYGYAIENVIKECNLSRESINNLRKLYYGIIKN